MENVDLQKLWATIEPENLVKAAYPEMVNNFEASKVKKPTKRKQKKVKDPLEELDSMLQNTSISEIDRKKPRKNKPVKKQTATIDNYFKKAVLNNFVLGQERDIDDPIQTSTPNKKSSSSSFLFKSSFLSDDEECADLSDIIQNIVTREPLIKNTIAAKINEKDVENDSCTFFTNNLKPNDTFEQSFNIITAISDESCDEMEMEEMHEIDEAYKVGNLLNEENSFEICTVPLSERIHLK